MDILNLEQYRFKKAKIFLSYDRGRDIRKKSGITNIKELTIIIPKDIYCINYSFWVGLLEDYNPKMIINIKNQGEYPHKKNFNYAIKKLSNGNTNALIQEI